MKFGSTLHGIGGPWLARRRYFVELVGKRRVKIISCQDLDGYRLASAEVIEHDTHPQEGSSEVGYW